MKTAGALMLVVALAVGACGEDPAAVEARAKAAEMAARPWEKARTILDAARTDVRTLGVGAVAVHAAPLEDALAGAAAAIVLAGAGPARLLLVDGGPDLAVSPTVQQSPYPAISLLLAEYYTQAGRPQDALRVLDAGLALPSAAPGGARASVPTLTRERAAVLGRLGRWTDALAAWEAALGLPGQTGGERAALLRGRAAALNALHRPNEADLSLRAAQRLDPAGAAPRP